MIERVDRVVKEGVLIANRAHIAKPYANFAHFHGVKHFAYAYDGSYYNGNNLPIKPNASHITISCIGYRSLQSATITASRADLPHFLIHSLTSGVPTRQNSSHQPLTRSVDSSSASISSTAPRAVDSIDFTNSPITLSPTAPTTARLLQTLHNLCITNGVLHAAPPQSPRLFTALQAYSHTPNSWQFRIFSLESSALGASVLDSHTTHSVSANTMPVSAMSINETANVAAYENAHSQAFVPLIMLPLSQGASVSGAFLFDGWFCVYRDGILLYDCVCDSKQALRDAIGLVGLMYDYVVREIFYHKDMPLLANGEIVEGESTQTHSTPDFTPQDFSQDSTQTLEQACVQNPIQNPAPHDLSLAFTPIHTPLPQMLESLLASYIITPLINPQAKRAWQTTSLRFCLALVACCAITLGLPFFKLAYAAHIDEQAAALKLHNEQISKDLQEKKLAAAQIPAQSAHITKSIQNLSTIHARYTSRLYILSTLSQIVRDADSWIVKLSLQGALDKGETLVELACQSHKQEGIAAIIAALESTPNIELLSTQGDTIVDSTQKHTQNSNQTLASTAQTNIIQTSEQSPSDTFYTTIALKILYA